MKDYNLDNRKRVIGGIAVVIVVIYVIRLFALQVMSDDYRKSADSNAFLKKIEFPSRGVIRDRNGKLLVYNQPSYDIMVVMNEERGHLDTLDFCRTLGITKEMFIKRMNDIKDPASRIRQRIPVTPVLPNRCSCHKLTTRTSASFARKCSAIRDSISKNVPSGNICIRMAHIFSVR